MSDFSTLMYCIWVPYQHTDLGFLNSLSTQKNPFHWGLEVCWWIGDFCLPGFLNNKICHGYRRRQWHPTPVLLPGKSHGWRSLVGCSPWGREESDTTERLHFRFSLSCIGEGNGNPLQCSCLENPMDGGTWWAAVYAVAQSRTRLKRLSSSSMQWNSCLTSCFGYWSVTISCLHVRCVQLSATPWTVTHQALLPMGFSRQEYWSGLPFPPPGHLPDPEIEPAFLASPALQTDFYCLSPGRIRLSGQTKW